MTIAPALVAIGTHGCSDHMEPNTALGLRVAASVQPATLAIGDSSASFTVRVALRPTEGERLAVTLVDTTAVHPTVLTADPAYGAGLRVSLRIASAGDPLNAGPSLDEWGTVSDTIPANGLVSVYALSLREWGQGGWPLEPGMYRVRVWYNMQEGESATLTLVP